MTATRILVFAKAPAPGRVKTRLIPALGAAGAARLARSLLSYTLDAALAAAVGPVELCASPAFGEPDWAGWSLPPGVIASGQGEGDLGARMARAARRTLDRGERALLIGTDCPALSARRLREAAAALEGRDAVLYPAADGGYTLLGLGAFHAGVFDGIPWSTAQVAGLTLARMAALHWRVAVGAELHDVDEPADLVHLPDDLGLTARPHARGNRP